MPNQDHLSAELRRLRKTAGLSGTAAAEQAGLSQSKISRVETGAFMPTEDQVELLCRIYRAPAAVRRELVAITRDIRAEATSARVILQRGAWRMQQRIGKIEAASALIRSFDTSILPGLSQIEAYITALFGDALPPDERDKVVAARLERQHILDSDREFHLLLAEGALRWNMGGAKVMSAQIDHLVELSHRGNVRLGVIPWTTPLFVPAQHSFTIYDSRAVLIGTVTATALITDERDVAEYEQHLGELMPSFVFDDDARAVLARVAADYHTLGA